jgi:DNA helicase-2/ATP-dependent DNA helicase PcrA
MQVQKIFGPPGSGKTTYLLNLVEKELDEGTSSSAMGYFSFTRKASIEARERAIQKFPFLVPDMDFPWFRTLHSLAYHCLGVGTKDMMKPENYREFGRQVGIDVSTEEGDEEFSVKADSPILNQMNLARLRGEDLRAHYNRSGLQIEWLHFEYVARAYRHYKEEKELFDFNDLLEKILEQPERLPSLDVLIVDEAQDLSKLQWNIVSVLAQKAKRTFLAGDDDQAVYNWAGADVGEFLGFKGEPVVLRQSYRVPLVVHELANKVVNRIRIRQKKMWYAREERGEILFYSDFRRVDVSQGEWLILGATNYLLNGMHSWLKSEGVLFERHGQRSIPENVLSAVLGWETLRRGESVTPQVVRNIYKFLGPSAVARGQRSLASLPDEGIFSMKRLQEQHGLETDDIWHVALSKIDAAKREYIIALLRRKTRLTGEVRVKLSTIHGAKGGEADNVMLLMDLSTRFSDEYLKNPDDINRLLYVALTRTKQSLHLVHPINAQKAFFL